MNIDTAHLKTMRIARVLTAVVVAMAVIAVLMAMFAPPVALGEPDAGGLVISKEGPDTIFAGGPITYTLRITNTSTSVAQGVVVTDTFVQQGYDGNYTVSGGVSVVSSTLITQSVHLAQFLLADMPAGTNGTIQLTMSVAPNFQPQHNGQPIILGNSAVISTSTAGLTGSADDLNTLIVGPVLRLSKTFTPTLPRPGRLLTYTFKLENLFRSDSISATHVVITEKIPSLVDYYAASGPATINYFPAEKLVRWDLTQPVAVSSTVYVTLTVRVTNTLAPNATIPNPSINCGTFADGLPLNIPCLSNISTGTDNTFEKVSQTVSPPLQTGPISRTFPNRVVTYTVSFYNPFETTVNDAIITDALPSTAIPNLPTQTFQYSDVIAASPAGLPTFRSFDGKNVSWQLPAVQGWGLYTFTFRAFIPPQIRIDDNQVAGRDYGNELRGSANGIVLQNNLGDDQSKVKVMPQITHIKSVNPTQELYGSPVTYTISISNAGPTIIRNIQITDVLPTNPNPGCAFYYDGYIANSGTAPSNVSSSMGGFSNTVSWNQGITLTGYEQRQLAQIRAIVVGAVGATCDNEIHGYSPDTFVLRMNRLATVRVLSPFGYDKTVTPATVVMSGSIQYTVKQFSISNASAHMTQFFDVLPTGFFYNGSPVFSQSVDLNLLPNYGNEYLVTFPVTVVSSPENCDNLFVPRPVWQRTGSFGMVINSPANLSGAWSNAADAAQVLVHPHGQVQMQVNPPGALPGGVVTFTLTVSNNTTYNLDQLQVDVTMPTGYTFGNPISPTPAPTALGPPVVRWTSQTLPPSGKLVLQFTAKAPTIVTQPNYPFNVKVTQTTNPNVCIPKLSPALDAPVAEGKIEVRKLAVPQIIGPLGETVYEIRLRNLGPYTVTIPTFIDYLPGVEGKEWVFQGMTVPQDQTPIATVPPTWQNLVIARGQEKILRFKVRANAQVGPYPNYLYTIPAGGYMTGTLPVSWTLVAQQQLTTTALVTVTPGIGLAKEAAAGPVIAGQQALYTITLVNVSGQTINNVMLTDTLPAGFTFFQLVSGIPPFQTSPVVVWNLGNVLSGEVNKRVLVFKATVSPNQASGTYYNQVAASTTSAASIQPTGPTAPVQVIGEPGLDLSKSANPTTVIAGRQVTYTLRLVNANTDPVTARITDTLPANFSFANMVSGVAPNSTTPPYLVWNSISVAANTTTTLVFRANVSLNTPESTYYNRLDGSSSTIVFQGTGDSAPVQVLEVPKYDLQVSKSDGAYTATIDSDVVYSVRYTNTVNALGLTVHNVVLTETFSPAAYLVANAPGWNLVSPGVYTRALGNLASGATGVFTFGLHIDAAIPAQYRVITNTAQIGGNPPPAVPEAIEQTTANNSFTDLDTIRGSDIAVTALSMSGLPKKDMLATYVVTMTNLGVEPVSNTVDNLAFFWVDLYIKPLQVEPNAAQRPAGPNDRYLGYCLNAPNVPCSARDNMYKIVLYLAPQTSLAPGQTITTSFQQEFETGGLHYIYAQADIYWPGACNGTSFNCGASDTGRISEGDEQNNIFGPLIIDVQGESLIYMPIIRKS